ncbi:HupE/UreJ family protein [Lutimaribacter sp. EGI FJ00015]|uniref:HupE/UreJ family protein n=2 Tax=Lutimaribacter degradans TaxID=2945989 RepID=A0ACC5ZUG4_9RHOB|nr:HupE/UreJ family protein [Lutimaribacter sp. EGI FJ00013]MCM2561189.1 HupE/UreJ family protein [Lutimaribacter sp. EGI FJ00013]MCO0611862.1 HupE/UreJ family protein [Lutimaribacter sp. EGI FJ00015]MCO0635017.1 HupE/UreJ family protein [Lutimaribacter sp. EGI FJ00014]
MQWLCLSMLLSLLALPARAHEVQPTIADLETAGGTVTLSLRMNAEAFVAGLDLDGLEDTNAAENADDYDALRALSPDDMAQRLQDAWPQIGQGITLRAGQAPVPLILEDVQVEAPGYIELPRPSQVVLRGDLPAGASALALEWGQGYGALILRQQGVDEPFTGYLNGGETSPPIPLTGQGAPKSGLAVFAEYIPVGFDHILPKGLDHILFVLGLFFLSTHLRPLVWQITAFTAAHTVTLALGALGWVNISGAIVEPLIAASIVYVAVENIWARGLNPWRPAVIFGFGLLHGLGFASVLGEFGLPDGQFVPALIGFNIGVEIGQLTVIAIAFAIVALAQRVDRGEADLRPAQVGYGLAMLGFVALSFALDGPGFAAYMGAGAPVFFWPLAALCLGCVLAVTFVDQLESYRRFVAIPASVAIAAVGGFWFVERVFL